MTKLWPKRLSWQYFLSYFLVMLAAMGMLLLYTYGTFYRFHSRQLLDEYHSRVALLRETQENAMDNLLTLHQQLTESDEVAPFRFADAPELGVRLINRLKTLKATNQYVHSLYMYYYGESYVYSNLSSYTIDNFNKWGIVFDNLSAEQLFACWSQAAEMTMLPVQHVSGINAGKSQKELSLIPIFIPLNYMNAKAVGTMMYLIRQETYDNWFNTIISDSADVYVLQDNKPLVQRNLSGVPLDVILQQEKENADSQTISCEGKKYHLLHLNGADYSYEYMVLISDEELQVAMNNSVTLLLLFCALAAALCSLLIVRMVQSRMKPIKIVHSMLSDRVPTGNELIEIRDGVQRLIETNAAIASKMGDYSTLQKSDFARRFLSGAFVDMDDFLARADLTGINVDVPCYAVAVVAKPTDGNYSLQPEKLNMLFDDQVNGVSRAFATNDRAVMILFAQSEQQIMNFLEEKLAGMRAVCMGITLAVSNVHSNYKEGQVAYLEADNAFDLRFIKGNSQVIRFSSLKENAETIPEYNQQLVEYLRAALHGGNGDLVVSTLNDISRAMRGMHSSLFIFRCMYHDIINVIIAEARKNGMDFTEVYDPFKLSQCLSIEDLDSMLRNVCTKLIHQRPKEAQSQASQAKDIFDRRFYELDLSISSVAEELGLNDSKLSNIFKQQYLMTPMEYVTGLRMHRARHLLRTTHMAVKDIAIECGYYDISGFNRRFKMHSKMTPQQYRQSYIPDPEEGMKNDSF